MSDFSVEYVGDTPGDIQKRLAESSSIVRQKTKRSLKKTAIEIQSDLEETSPVDTGEYQNSWYIFEVAYDEVWILNEADHAKYVMLPNTNMVNSTSADLPSQGILHNVKGVAKNHQKTLNLNMADELKRMIRSLR